MNHDTPSRTRAVLALSALLWVGGCDHTPDTAPPPDAAPTTAAAQDGPSSAPSPRPEAPPAVESSATPGIPALEIASFPPRDDCSAQPGWREFRTRLGKAVQSRDADALARLADANVQLDYGGGAGVATLRARLDDAEFHLWDELAKILPLGCGLQDGLAAMPWIFWNAPETIDPYDAMWVTGTNVPLHKTPRAGSPVTETLDWALVAAAPQMSGNPKFRKVTADPGKTAGFVEARHLRSVIDYRLIAEPKDGGWHITAIVAGD